MNALRSRFPGAAHAVYFDTATLGLVAGSVAEAVSRLAARLLEPDPRGGTAAYLDLEAAGDEARRELAVLLGGAPEDFALVESTTHGLQIAASALPLPPGSEVLIADWDFLD